MRIALTGASGVLGTILMAHWSEPEFVQFESDISEYSNFKNWYEESGPFDGVIHLAALVPVEQAKAEPLRAFNVNVRGTLNVLETIRTQSLKNKPWIFYSSTSHVYENSKDPLKETSTINPITFYGQTKAQGDKWCEIYREQYGLNVCVGRIFSNSSPNQP